MRYINLEKEKGRRDSIEYGLCTVWKSSKGQNELLSTLKEFKKSAKFTEIILTYIFASNLHLDHSPIPLLKWSKHEWFSLLWIGTVFSLRLLLGKSYSSATIKFNKFYIKFFTKKSTVLYFFLYSRYLLCLSLLSFVVSFFVVIVLIFLQFFPYRFATRFSLPTLHYPAIATRWQRKKHKNSIIIIKL